MVAHQARVVKRRTHINAEDNLVVHLYCRRAVTSDDGAITIYDKNIIWKATIFKTPNTAEARDGQRTQPFFGCHLTEGTTASYPCRGRAYVWFIARHYHVQECADLNWTKMYKSMPPRRETKVNIDVNEGVICTVL